MSGLKTNWQTGDVVTAEKLNAMQYAVVDMTHDESAGTTTLNIKSGELLELVNAGTPVFLNGVEAGMTFFGLVIGGAMASGEYTFLVTLFFSTQPSQYGAGNADDYPVLGYSSDSAH